MGSQIKSLLPIVDLNIEENMTSWASTADQVRSALESYGCFIAKYQKIPTELHDRMFKVSRELFELPTETKVKNTCSIAEFGYATNFSFMPLVEFFGIENGATLEATKDFTNLMWPAGNDIFCETAFTYSKLLSEVDHQVMRLVFASYGVEKYCDPILNSSFYLTRFMKYRTPRVDEINVGLQPHVDRNFLAILGTNHVAALEIETKDGQWITYKPSPSGSTFLVIAGEPFQAWSNGRIYAPVHQVMIRGNEEKYTVGLFSFMRGTVNVPEELVNEENPLKFKPFDQMKFIEFLRGGRHRKTRLVEDFCGV